MCASITQKGGGWGGCCCCRHQQRYDGLSTYKPADRQLGKKKNIYIYITWFSKRHTIKTRRKEKENIKESGKTIKRLPCQILRHLHTPIGWTTTNHFRGTSFYDGVVKSPSTLINKKIFIHFCFLFYDDQSTYVKYVAFLADS